MYQIELSLSTGDIGTKKHIMPGKTDRKKNKAV